LPTVQTLVPVLKIGSQVVPGQQSPSAWHISPTGRQQSPLWQTCAPLQHWFVPQQLVRGGQQNEFWKQQTSKVEQHVWPQGAVPAAHSHTQVSGFSAFGGEHAGTQVPPQATVPASQPAHRPVTGSQNLLQHSALSRQGWAFLRHRVAPAGVATVQPRTVAPVAAAK
jgi:hypothetical protein